MVSQFSQISNNWRLLQGHFQSVFDRCPNCVPVCPPSIPSDRPGIGSINGNGRITEEPVVPESKRVAEHSLIDD